MLFTKNHNIMISSVFEWLYVVVTIVCWHTMALVVFHQEDEMSQVCIVFLRFFVKRPPEHYMQQCITDFRIFIFKRSSTIFFSTFRVF